jgi:uncharacterized protein (DUF1330 family)
MSAYFIVDLKVHDPEAFAEYSRQVTAIVAKHGGEYLARGGATEVMEGTWTPGRLVLVRFPSRQAIHNFLNDPAYQPVKALRQKTSTGNMVAVDGV